MVYGLTMKLVTQMSTIAKYECSNLWRQRLIVASILSFSLHVAHAELVVYERDPESSIVNRYEDLRDADQDTLALHQFVAELNEQVKNNPNDALAWGIMAKIYDQQGYDTYAVYAASEAINKGYADAKLQQILLNNSISIAEYQLTQGYLEGIDDEEFLREYTAALSKIYGTVHNLNYDESLPKPVVKTVPAQRRSRAQSTRRAPSRQAQKTTKQRAVRQSKPSSTTSQSSMPRPTSPPVKRTPPKTSAPTDPFGILR